MDHTKIIFTRKRLLDSVGFEKATSKSLQILADQIQRTTGQEIGFNTLRRFFGLLKSTNPNAKTWMIIEDYIKDVAPSEEKRRVEYVENWHPFHSMYLYLYQRDSNRLIQFLKEKADEHMFPQLIGTLTCQLIAAKNLALLSKIYQEDVLFQSSKGFAGNFAAEIICGTLKMIPEDELMIFLPVFSLPNFKNSIFYFHIDYAFLNGYYGRFLELFDADSEDEQLFLDCILGYRAFLNGQPLSLIKKPNHASLFDYHPTLVGRYVGYQILLHPHDTEKLMDEMVLPLAKNFEPHYFFIEVVQALMLNKNLQAIQFLIGKYYESLYEIDHWFSYIPYNIYLIAEAFVYLYEGDLVRAKVIFTSVNIELTPSSYYAYTKLFYLVLNYQLLNEVDLKEGVISEYQTLTEDIDFPRFSTDFIKNYMSK